MPLPSILGIALLVLVLLLLLVWRRGRRRASEAPRPMATPQQDHGDLDYYRRAGIYWGAAIQSRQPEHCCAPAAALLGKPFPLAQVPQLPLSGCDAEDCQCHYQPILDHRSGKARRVNTDRRSILRYEPDKKDRRQVPGRREKDPKGKSRGS